LERDGKRGKEIRKKIERTEKERERERGMIDEGKEEVKGEKR